MVKGIMKPMANNKRESREEKRQERMKELRRLGFDARNANRLKDQSGPNIERAITARRKNLERRKRLNPVEQEYLVRLQERAESGPQKTIERTFSTRDRQAQFEEWTANKSFPDEVLEMIREINDSRNKPESDGFGYRQFYYAFVKRRTPAVAARLADRDDS